MIYCVNGIYSAITKISKWGNSCGIRIPKEAMMKMGFNLGDTVQIEIDDGKMTIRKVSPSKDLKSYLENYYQKPINEVGIIENNEEEVL
jgi:antitoxin MazE